MAWPSVEIVCKLQTLFFLSVLPAEIDDEFDENEKKLLDYSKTIEDLNQKMKRYLEEIGTKAEYHRNCNP